MRKIIIDTDIGDDADDALAIGLALSANQFNILGITTVYKNTQMRAKMAKHLVTLAGHDNIPVHSGMGHSLNNENTVDEIPCQYRKEMEHVHYDGEDAVEFIAEQLRNERLTIVAIGPLTNIAMLMTTYPELIGRIEELVIMGGCYYRHVNEWNIVCDPEAADIVFKSGVNIKAVGLDVTTKCHFNDDILKSAYEKADTPLKQLMIDCCEAWLKKTGFTPILHDPLTIFALMNESDIQFSPENIQIELTGKLTRGMTVCSEDGIWGRKHESPTAVVATALDYQRFIQIFHSNLFLN
ncbi:nucleoside hydrolase (plasmid) [Photobacterium sp. DA100]|uniref:nucleoside hydrolase n=1 Tax=Photobacterium sp. DA100 TaxID=3027472 RepID=UPI0024795DF2|nr:nucleoside hydrolase [Photobacterium sp. DA100]WEM45534.1 nucleoside hydrolase [Photobacterium sp. DA100]